MIGLTVQNEPQPKTCARGGTWLQRWRVPLGFLCGDSFSFSRDRALPRWCRRSRVDSGFVVCAPGPPDISGKILPLPLPALTLSLAILFTLAAFSWGSDFTIGSGFWPLGILFALLFLGIYFPVMRVESATLAELFGKSFQDYAREVPLFFPRVTPYRSDGPANDFDRSLYMRYREYRAALGLVIAWALLVFKAYYFR